MIWHNWWRIKGTKGHLISSHANIMFCIWCGRPCSSPRLPHADTHSRIEHFASRYVAYRIYWIFSVFSVKLNSNLVLCIPKPNPDHFQRLIKVSRSPLGNQEHIILLQVFCFYLINIIKYCKEVYKNIHTETAWWV